MAATVSLVIPSYNEERRLPRLAAALRDSAARELADSGLELVETIVVDDGSLDSSADVLHQAGKLRAAIEDGADIAIGSRAIDPRRVTGIPLRRRLMGRAFNGLVRGLSGLPYRDTQCGIKLFRAPVARRLLAAQITPGFAFDVELLMRARRDGLRVDEVAIEYHHDPDSSIAAASASIGMARDVARLAWRLRRR